MNDPEPGGRASAWRVERIASIAQLQHHRAAYEALLARLPGAAPRYYAIESLRATAALFIGSHDRMFFLLAWHGDVLSGVAPWLLDSRPWPRLRRLHAWGAVHGLMGLDADLLVPPGPDASRCVQALAAYLAGPAAHGFDAIALESVREDSVLAHQFAAVFAQGESEVESEVSHLADVPETAEAYEAMLSATMLKDLRRRERVLERSGQVEFCPRRQLDETELDEVMAIHGARQSDLADQGKERQLVFAAERERTALLDLLAQDERTGRARHLLLKLDGRTIAFALGFVCGDLLVGHTTAFDPAHRKSGPGRMVALRLLEVAIGQDRIRCVDMGKGTTQIKLDLGNRTVRHVRLTLRNTASLRSRWRCAAWALASRAAAGVRAALRPQRETRISLPPSVNR